MISMYAHIVQLVSQLKAYGIKKVVFSGGNRNIPLQETIISDPFFECYSHLDERTAAYFALGLAVKSNEIVAISCTSGTALANYTPAVVEAFYQKVPLLILSADRPPLLLDQNEDQMINQTDIFKNFVKKFVNLPFVHGPHTTWGCRILITEALNQLRHHGDGPVHINFPIEDSGFKFKDGIAPVGTPIPLLSPFVKSHKEYLLNRIKNFKRIAIMCGQTNGLSKEESDLINKFCVKYNAIVIADALSNVQDLTHVINLALMNRNHPKWVEAQNLFPDLVIQIGGRTTFGVNGRFRANKNLFEYWLVSSSGNIADLFRNIKCVIESDILNFFEMFSSDEESIKHKSGLFGKRLDSTTLLSQYYTTVRSYLDKCIGFPKIPYSNIYSTKRLMESIPAKSLVHLGILDSLNHGLLFLNKNNVECYSNRPTWGIDGTLASFLGQAYLHDNLAYLLIGDLSFFYGMNAIWSHHIKNNVRIMLNNNNGTSTIEPNAIRYKIDVNNWGKYQGTRHNATAKGWAESVGFKYLEAHNQSEFEEKLKEFHSKSDKPVLFEVFTDNKVNHSVKSSTSGYMDKLPIENK